MNVCLCKMTKSLNRQFFREFVNDPDLFADMGQFYTYHYNEPDADAYWERQESLGRIHLAIMLGEKIVGEVILKNIDHGNRSCTLSIHMMNDSVKNCGYGTEAEILTLEYAFGELKMETVFADALLKNERSRHVLEKVGFKLFSRDNGFCYYRCDRDTWTSHENRGNGT